MLFCKTRFVRHERLFGVERDVGEQRNRFPPLDDAHRPRDEVHRSRPRIFLRPGHHLDDAAGLHLAEHALGGVFADALDQRPADDELELRVLRERNRGPDRRRRGRDSRGLRRRERAPALGGEEPPRLGALRLVEGVRRLGGGRRERTQRREDQEPRDATHANHLRERAHDLRLGDGPSLGVAPRRVPVPVAVPRALFFRLVVARSPRFLVAFVVRGDDLRERLSSLALLDVQELPAREPQQFLHRFDADLRVGVAAAAEDGPGADLRRHGRVDESSQRGSVAERRDSSRHEPARLHGFLCRGETHAPVRDAHLRGDLLDVHLRKAVGHHHHELAIREKHQALDDGTHVHPERLGAGRDVGGERALAPHERRRAVARGDPGRQILRRAYRRSAGRRDERVVRRRDDVVARHRRKGDASARIARRATSTGRSAHRVGGPRARPERRTA